MAFCKYCGKKLEDGELCSCEDALNAAKAKAEAEAAEAERKKAEEERLKAETEKAASVPAEPVKEDAPKQEDKPVQEVLSVPVVTNDEATEAKILRRGLAIVFTLAALFIICIVLAAHIFGNGYKKPFRRMVRGINTNRAELVIDSMYPDEYIEELKDNADSDDMEWNEVEDELGSLISDMKEVCGDGYFGDRTRVNIKLSGRKDTTGREYRNIKKHFDDMDTEVRKAFKIKTEITVKGSDEAETVRVNLFAVKLSGGKWVVFADDKAMGKLTERAEKIVRDFKDEAKETADDYSDTLKLFKTAG